MQSVAVGPTQQTIESVPELVRGPYKVVGEFEKLFLGRSFTPVGHLVCSIGGVVAAHTYRLRLLSASSERHDAVARNGWLVQVKATHGKSVALRSEPHHLIVLQFQRSGSAEEIYNGPRAPVWAACGAMLTNGQRPISLRRLRTLLQGIP